MTFKIHEESNFYFSDVVNKELYKKQVAVCTSAIH